MNAGEGGDGGGVEPIQNWTSEINNDGSVATTMMVDMVKNVVPPHTNCKICVPNTNQCSPCAAT